MGAAENTLKRIRQQYEKRLEEETELAAEACEIALRAIGIEVTDRVRDKIYNALSEAL